MTTLPLSEVFGPTWQGEGPYCGVRCGFVRLGMCNLTCEWCDTAYTWDRSLYDLSVECPDVRIEDIQARVRDMGVRTVILTGGEPMIHWPHLGTLMETGEWEWHVETNGTIGPPHWWPRYVTHTSVSPKLDTRDPEGRRIKPTAIQRWVEMGSVSTLSVAFKFVCRNVDSLDRVAKFADRFDLMPESVWIMPEGVTSAVILDRHRAMAPAILDRGWNTTTRLHTLLYETERAR